MAERKRFVTKLFCYVETMFRLLEWENKGIKLGEKCLLNMSFVNDLVLLDNNSIKIKKMVHELVQEGVKFALSSIIGETKKFPPNTQGL